jgi:hypothetical protein
MPTDPEVAPLAGPPPPKLGQFVNYRSRTGRFTVPAVVSAISSSLDPQGVQLWRDSGGQAGVPPLSSSTNVHLVVFTPEIPRMGTSTADFVGARANAPVGGNVSGCFQEWDVPYDSAGSAGTWE